jgi:hypothetical protein
MSWVPPHLLQRARILYLVSEFLVVGGIASFMSSFSCMLIKVQVWLSVNNGYIEFLTFADSYKVKRIRRDPSVICYIGDKEGPSISGTAEIFMGIDSIWRVYRAYWKTHPLIMAFIAFPTRRRIRNHKEVLIRVRPNVPNPLADVTDPVV